MGLIKVLYVCHNHPAFRPGGAEAYALELYSAMCESSQVDPIFLARRGPGVSPESRGHSGTPFGMINGDPRQYFFFTDNHDFDYFYMTLKNKDAYSIYFDDFLRAHRPDVVHFQHTIHLGLDLIRQARKTLPDSPIVYTLHEFLPICHRSGQMVRTATEELCLESSPRRCNECFPDIPPQNFFLRRRFVQSAFALVDLFLAPSRFLMDRHVEWGIPDDKILLEEYGRLPIQPIETREDRPKNRIGFFGQINRFKGADVLLESMKIIGERDHSSFERRASVQDPIHLWLYGANLELQPGTYQNRFQSLVDETSQNVTVGGCYSHQELPELMSNVDWVVVPSRWWENSPLVIQEAFMNGKPVICSGIGGMAEKVTHGVNGLHFRVGDPVNLAETIERAVHTQGLWEKLRRGIPKIYPMSDHVEAMIGTYRSLLTKRRSSD